MQIEYHDGTKIKKEYEKLSDLAKDAEKAIQDPKVKKITITKPKLKIPKKRR